MDYKGVNCEVTPGWWRRFSQRHPEVSLRSAVPLSLVRAKAMDIETLNRYFDILETTLKDNGIYNNPSRIFNCDESGLPLAPKGVKVVAKRGAKVVSSISSDTKSQVTVLGCVCANGNTIPPFIIFDRKTLNPELTTGEIPGTIYGLSSKGWINQELFMGWFYRHFIPSVPSIRPLLLIMDGHSSHYCPEVIKMAAKEKILLFTLPPHTTHISQPLDRGCFAPLKTNWKKVCHLFYTNNPGRVITKYDFSSLFAEAWKLSMTQTNVLSGFRVCGIYPYSRESILSKIPQDDEPAAKALTEATGLAYIPLYSPIRPPSGRDTQISPPMHESTGCSMLDESSVFNKSLSEGDLSNISLKLIQRNASSISRFLSIPTLPSKLPTKNTKSCGRVLTSEENMKWIEEKEEAKQKALAEKEQRRLLREQKAKDRSKAKKRGGADCGKWLCESYTLGAYYVVP